MIFITFFIACICFPGLIIYKPLPGFYFKYLLGKHDADRANESQHQENAVAWCGIINVGLFLVFKGLGAMITAIYAKPEDGFKMKNVYCIGIILFQMTFCTFILYVTIGTIDGSLQKSNFWASMALIAMFGLAFLHGLTSSHFLTWKPDLREIPHNEQAQAHAQRSCLKYLGTCLGILVQIIILTTTNLCFYGYQKEATDG